MKLKGMAGMFGIMEGSIKGLGVTIKCMVKACLSGLMGGRMKVSIYMIRNKAGESLFGRMGRSMKGSGIMGSNMGQVLFTMNVEKPGMAYGRMGNFREGNKLLFFVLW